MNFASVLSTARSIWVKQVIEGFEFVGFETRNKYSIQNEQELQIAFAAEQQKGIFGFIFRQMLGHWRRFDVHVFDEQRNPIYKLTHPFRFIFQRVEVTDTSGRVIGAIQQRFSFLYKRFQVEDAGGNVLFKVSSPFWRLWTFRFKRNDNEMAIVTKRWGGALKEYFTDADKFQIEFGNASINLNERILIMSAAIYIDLKYFERKSRKPAIEF